MSSLLCVHGDCGCSHVPAEVEGEQGERSKGQGRSNNEQLGRCQGCMVEESGDQELGVLEGRDTVVDWLLLRCSLVEFVVRSYSCFITLEKINNLILLF